MILTGSRLSDPRVFRSPMSANTGTFTLISGTAYFVYVGKTIFDQTPKFVEFFQSVLGAGGQTAEVGLFSTPLPPNKGNQSLTKLVATATVDTLTVGTIMKRNTSAFATIIAGQTHLWAGIRTVMATTQPGITGLFGDCGEGFTLRLVGSGALTGAGPFAGVVVAAGNAVNTPDLRVTLD